MQTSRQGTDDVVLSVKDLRTYFYTRWGTTKAVDGVSFDLRRGETLGLVGESGCGKSVTVLSVMRLVPIPPGRIVSGEVWLDGQDVLKLSERQMSHVRGSKISMILQDPMTALNPVFNIQNQVEEPLRIHQHLKGRSLYQQVIDALRRVRIPAPEIRVKDFPHQLSGGMRQRVVGAISISCSPLVLVADEPTTSLDVTIQAQYLRLLKDLQEQVGLSIIFITHDFGIVAKMCDRVNVMYAGRTVEEADVRSIFNEPTHPYTQALIGSLPKLEEDVQRLYSIEGQPPALYALPSGYSYHPRCSQVMDVCRLEYPPEFMPAESHMARCWLLKDSPIRDESQLGAAGREFVQTGK